MGQEYFKKLYLSKEFLVAVNDQLNSDQLKGFLECLNYLQMPLSRKHSSWPTLANKYPIGETSPLEMKVTRNPLLPV